MNVAYVNLAIGVMLGSFLAGLLSHVINTVSSDTFFSLKWRECNACSAPYNLRTSFPVVGYLARSGTCSTCGQKESLLDPFLELLVILFSVWAFIQLDLLSAFQISLLFFALLGIAVLDTVKWIVPNIFVIVIVLVALLGMMGGQVSGTDSLKGLGIALMVSGIILLPQMLGEGQSGYALGDVKMSLAVAVWLGWVLTVYVFFFAAVFSFLAWIILGIYKGFSISRPVQFGPFIALSSLVFGIGRVVDPQFITHLLTFRF